MCARAAAALALCATAAARYVNLPGVASPQMGYNSCECLAERAACTRGARASTASLYNPPDPATTLPAP
jgi:hypothetical protein